MDKEGNKTGGRQRGTPNKKNQELLELAKELDCNPAKILMHFAMNDTEALGLPELITKTNKSGDTWEEPTISPELQKAAASDLMPYMYGKRKPVDSDGNDKGDPLSELADAIRNRQA
jgi:hypothetical protein